MAFANLYYRTWLIIIGEVITFLIVPLLAMALPVTGCMGLISARKHTEENQWTTSIGFRLIYEDGTKEETRIRIHDEVTQEYVEEVIRDMYGNHENYDPAK